jgi:hypothetical protein
MANKNHNMKRDSREGVQLNTFYFTLTHHGLFPILPAGKSGFLSIFSLQRGLVVQATQQLHHFQNGEKGGEDYAICTRDEFSANQRG